MSESRPAHILSGYCVPRGAHRMYALGQRLAQTYLPPRDKLIGSGKSTLIRGMFPGLELTNDDNGVYVRSLHQDQGFAFFSLNTCHLDIRFENGFTQMSILAEAIAEALDKGRRGVVEHFDLDANHLIYDRFKRRYLPVGCVGKNFEELLQRLDNQRQRPGWNET